MDEVISIFRKSAQIKLRFAKNNAARIGEVVNVIIKAFQKGKKILIFGNGGSAADAQHIAGEFVGRFKRERKALPAVALSTDTSILTCIANDYDYESVFSRQVEALAKPGDVLIGISTSGSSPNVVEALKTAIATGDGDAAMVAAIGLEQIAKRYHTLLEQANDVILILDPDSARILDWNSKAEEMLGYDPKRTMLADDTEKVLHSADEYGLGCLIYVARSSIEPF